VHMACVACLMLLPLTTAAPPGPLDAVAAVAGAGL
jgi:hypothetical protein